jgi:hypothetical protein
MMFYKSKEEDLQRLEKFVKYPYIYGTWVCQVFLILSQKYPLQFVWYMRQHRTIKDDPSAGDVVDRSYPQALQEVNRLYARLQDYLLQPPQTPEQQEEFRAIVNTLEDLLLKQNQEN